MTVETIEVLGHSSQWMPQMGAQQEVWDLDCEHVLVAGSRGGGKSDLGIAMWVRHMEINEFENPGISKHCRGLVLRRTLPELKDLIERAMDIFGSQAEWKAAKKTFVFNNGAQIQFSYLERDAHARQYQGRQFTYIFIEEAGLFPRAEPIEMVLASLRSAHPIKKKVILTANPGGPGHAWLRRKYIDHAPAGRTIIKTPVKLLDGSTVYKERIYIPSHTSENKVLKMNNPDYEAQLREATKGQPHLAKAWIEGSWDIVAGGMWDSVFHYPTHVIPFPKDEATGEILVPRNWQIYRSYDWGSARPFSLGWYALTDGYPFEDAEGRTHRMARGSLVKVMEWYGATTSEKSNEGLSMLESDIAEQAYQRERVAFPHHEVLKGPADHNIFVRDAMGRCDADEWRRRGIRWKPADKERVKGWRKITEMLLNAREKRPEAPGLYFSDTCHATLRFLPVAPRDESFPDEISPDHEDHVLDEIRYMTTFRTGGGDIMYHRVA